MLLSNGHICAQGRLNVQNKIYQWKYTNGKMYCDAGQQYGKVGTFITGNATMKHHKIVWHEKTELHAKNYLGLKAKKEGEINSEG